MKFTVSPEELDMLLKAVGLTRPKAADKLMLYSCAARVFVEFKGVVAGVESLVFADGAVRLPAKKFLAVLKTYKGTPYLTFQGDPNGLQIQSFKMPVLEYHPQPKPPSDFKVFPAGSGSALLAANAAPPDAPPR